MATRKQWEQVEHWADTNCFAESCMLELRARVEALEATQHHHVEMAKPASVAEESSAAVSAPNYAARPMDADLLRHYQDARGDSLDRLRAVYDLGRKHGAAANSKPTPNDRQIRSSLVKKVEQAMENLWVVGEIEGSWDAQARAAIREVAKWLREAHGWEEGAQGLEREANRG